MTTYIDNSEDDDYRRESGHWTQNGPPISNATAADDLTTFDGTNYVDLFEPGTLRFTGAKGIGDGLELAEQELVIDWHDHRARAAELHGSIAGHRHDIRRSRQSTGGQSRAAP